MSTDTAADRAAVLEQNKAFYAAFEALDVEAMSRVWARRAQDVCIHPGWEILQGWHAIRESWRVIFANTDYMRFQPSDVQVEILGDVARVTCVENIFSVIEGHSLHSRVGCTHLFVRTPDGWRLTLHHGSPIAVGQVYGDFDTDAFH